LKLQTTIEKIKMYYTNCQRINHNVETYRVKRKDGSTIINYEVTIQQIRVQRRIRYSFHICGETRHKIIDCPKFNDMKNMFKNKRMHI
jgi:hypothetical protein